MTLQLPRPPSADRYCSDPQGWAGDLSDFLSKLVQELERDSRDTSTPAKAPFAVTNIAAPTTTLDGATAGIPEIRNFLGGLVATLLAKGIIRTKAGPA